jgi:hypothetical protein
MIRTERFFSIFVVLLWLGAGLMLSGCEDLGKKSAGLARAHVEQLSRAARQDLEEVRKGLPLGAQRLENLFAAAHPEQPDPQTARQALTRARDKVQDLRVAKSTFFAVASLDGMVIRGDGEADDLAGKNIVSAFPELARAVTQGYVESRGSMKEAAGVRGREDGQWVAAVPIKVEGIPKGLYVTGWSWSAYAYRLETAVRSQVLGDTVEGAKVPLLYVYVLVGDVAYGAPVSPMGNGRAILGLKPLEHAQGEAVWTSPLQIDGRTFGVAVQRIAPLGESVAVAVLRSET